MFVRSVRILSVFLVVLCIGAIPVRADVFDDACAYFKVRAENGTGNTVFRRHLSGQCQLALAEYRAAPPGTEAKRMAEDVLFAMHEFREVLEEIPRVRLARRYPPEILHDLPELLQRPVSASGEILIARAVGVTPRLNAWESWLTSQR